MKHLKPVGKSMPKVAGYDTFWCQFAVILFSVGIAPPKEFVEKCIDL